MSDWTANDSTFALSWTYVYEVVDAFLIYLMKR